MFTVDEKKKISTENLNLWKRIKVILELKNTIFEIEKSMGEFYSWLNTVKHQLVNLKRWAKSIQLKQKQRQKMKRTEHKRHVEIR